MSDNEFIAYAESVCFERGWSIGDIAAVTGDENGICCVEHDESGGIGYALGRCSFDEAELYRIAVLPEKRRLHAGVRLMERFIVKCREKGVEKIFLEVRSSNVPAIKLYEQSGFERISVRKRYYGDEDALIYLLTL